MFSYDRRASRPIYLDKRGIAQFVDSKLIPIVKRRLARIAERDEPMGSSHWLGEASLLIEDVKNHHVYADVTVQSAASTKKGTSVLRAWVSDPELYHGDYRCEVVVEVNGAFTPNELLGGQDVSMGTLQYKQDFMQPISQCRSLQCLPYGIYTQLLHELTHIADKFRPAVDYYNSDGSVDAVRYVNHPAEVRAIMQTMVEEAVHHGRKLKEHLGGNPQRLIAVLLKMSSEWKIAGPDMNAQNTAKIMKAIYTALVEDGIIEG